MIKNNKTKKIFTKPNRLTVVRIICLIMVALMVLSLVPIAYMV